jgi:hypothetical protein
MQVGITALIGKEDNTLVAQFEGRKDAMRCDAMRCDALNDGRR